VKKAFWFLPAALLLFVIAFVRFSHRAPPADDWMVCQIQRDLAPIAQTPLSKHKIREIANDPRYDGCQLVHISIRKNQVFAEHRVPVTHELFKDCLMPRMNAVKNSLQQVVRRYKLPDMEFLFSLHDALTGFVDAPVFVMAKTGEIENQILIPDFEALRGRYQVLASKDITEESAVSSWEEKKAQLVWRGGPGQHPPRGCTVSFSPEDPHCLSRIKLCSMSFSYPDLIDAKFTYLNERYASLIDFMGEFLPFESQILYKYQMQVDGYSCAYTTSGWKLFANCLMFKEDSEHFQWYYPELKPYEHYIPVQEGLSDLVEKIQWAMVHDDEAKAIARRAREFALSHITQDKNRLYLYHVLLAYSRLNWVD